MSLERLRQRVLVIPRVPARPLRDLVLSVWVPCGFRVSRLSHWAHKLLVFRQLDFALACYRLLDTLCPTPSVKGCYLTVVRSVQGHMLHVNTLYLKGNGTLPYKLCSITNIGGLSTPHTLISG